MSSYSVEAQLAVMATKLERVIEELSALRVEQKNTNKRLAKLESWRAFVLGVVAAVGAVGGWFIRQLQVTR